MYLISCTQRFISTTRFPIVKDLPADIDPLKYWHAHLFRVSKFKCLLFTHHKTLYTVVMTSVLAKDFKNLPELFLQRLAFIMTGDGFAKEFIDKFITDKEFSWSKNTVNDRKVLGSMNDMVRMIEYQFYYDSNKNDLELTKAMNDTPFSMLGKGKYGRPRDEMRNLQNQEQ